MDAVETEVIEEIDHVAGQAIERERQRVVRDLGAAVAAEVETHHPEVAGEPRHPGVQTLRAAHGRMQEHERLRRLPGVGEVVDHVAEADPVAGREVLHHERRRRRARGRARPVFFSASSSLSTSISPIMPCTRVSAPVWK